MSGERRSWFAPRSALLDNLWPQLGREAALVVSSGDARGFAHLGVLRVLERERLRPDLVVGASARAIVGAMSASGMAVSEIERAAAHLRVDEIRRLFAGS